MSEQVSFVERALCDALATTDPGELAEHPELPDAIREAVHAYCEAAQTSGLPPERVIRQLKEVIEDHYGRLRTRAGLWRAISYGTPWAGVFTLTFESVA